MPDKQVWLNRIRGRLALATPGPWEHFSAPFVDSVGTPGAQDTIVHWSGFDSAGVGRAQRKRNAEFIAHAREDVRMLLDLLAERERELASLQLPASLTAEGWAEFVHKDEGKTAEINLLTRENRTLVRRLAEVQEQEA